MAVAGVNQKLIDRVVQEFKSNFGSRPEIVLRSPGRINLIGEHTDYNNGLVLPAAVDQAIYFAIGQCPDNVHKWHALDKNEYLIPGHDQIGIQRGDWSDFLHGSWLALKKSNSDIPYFQAVFSGDLPIGAGMSSSSALTCGAIFAMNEAFDLKLERLEIASLAHRVEREFIGLRGGIMDQYASVLSKPNQFLLLDCNDLSRSFIPADESMHLFLINTNVQRELTESEYNSRSDECVLAVEQINAHLKINKLRDISIEVLRGLESHLQPIPFKRAMYVLAENRRVHEAVNAIQKSDWSRLGDILYSGHEGLRTEFEVSIPELDFLVELTKQEDWIYGARMMGGGFGGCTINISKHDPSEDYIDKLTADYSRQFGINPTFIPVSLAGGTQVLTKQV
jgi:galactokinase